MGELFQKKKLEFKMAQVVRPGGHGKVT